MMTRLLSSLGAFGASYALFSYFGSGALPYAICAALLVPLLSFALSRLPDRHRLPLLALLALLVLRLQQDGAESRRKCQGVKSRDDN